MHDEKLAACGIWSHGARHGENAAVVLQIVFEAVRSELALDAVTGAAHAVAVGAAALDHEAGDDAVEDQSVIKAGVGQGDEVVHALGRDVGIQLAGDDAAVLHLDGDDGIVSHNSFLFSVVMVCQPRFFSRMARSISRLASRLATASRLS